MEHACHLLVCMMYILIFYILGTGIDSLLYYAASDKVKRMLIILSTACLIAGYILCMYILIYLLFNVIR
jgi:hypothetical protein